MNQAQYGSYALVTVAIPATYAAPGNRVRFYATEDSMVPTAFVVDDVSVQ